MGVEDCDGEETKDEALALNRYHFLTKSCLPSTFSGAALDTAAHGCHDPWSDSCRAVIKIKRTSALFTPEFRHPPLSSTS